jgi:hypothetical protein
VRIDVDQLLYDREVERLNPPVPEPEKRQPSSKRKALDGSEPQPKRKRPKAKELSTSTPVAGPSASRVTLKLGPRPVEDIFPCCLCISTSRDGLFPVQDPPVGRRELPESLSSLATEAWMAHEECAKVVPETWVDEVETEMSMEKRVFGVDAIVRDRWNLVRSNTAKYFYTRLADVMYRNVLLVQKRDKRPMVHLSSVPKGNARNPFMLAAREMEGPVVLFSQYCARSRRK